MNICIRSQDKEFLMAVDRIDYSAGHIVAYQPGDDEEIILGTYDKKRSIEIIDEIQNIKFYKYMAQLDVKAFFEMMKEKSAEEQKNLLSQMSTYKMPKE